MNKLQLSLNHRLWDLDIVLDALANLAASEDEPVVIDNYFLGQCLADEGFAKKKKGSKGYLPTKKTEDLLDSVKQARLVEVPQ